MSVNFSCLWIASFKNRLKDGSELKYSAAQIHVKRPPS